MGCDVFQEDASSFMDGMLGASGQAALFAHLSTCTDCRSMLSTSVRVREVLRKDSTMFPEGLDEAVFERMAEYRAHKTRDLRPGDDQRTRKFFWRREIHLPLPLAAAALLLLILGSMLFSTLLFRLSTGGTTLESVLDKTQAAYGRQAVVVIYQLPEEQVIRPAPAKIFEVNARTVVN
jgi:anti-sigma factor RsiW